MNIGELMGTIRIAGVNEATTGLGRVSAGFTESGDAAKRASVSVDQSAAALTGAGRASSVASSGSAKFRAAQLSAVAATERYNAALNQEDASLGRLASAEAAVIRANERVSASTPVAAAASMNRELGATPALANKSASAFGGMAKTAASLGIMFGAFEVIKKAIDIGKQASQFQRQMLQIQTVAGASADEVKRMSSALLSLSGQVATAPDELAISLYHVEQNGLRGAKALEVVKTAAEGAKVGMADVEDTTNSMTSAVASGIKGVQNMDQAMGALLATAGTGDMTMQNLNEALGSGILTVAKTYGLSLKDVGASLAVFGDLNIRGSQAASTLRQAIMAFAKPSVGPAAKAMLDKLGLSTSTLAKDMQHGGLNQAITDLRSRLMAAGYTGDKVGKALLDLFGKKAGIGVSTLVDQYDRLQRKYAELDKGAQSFGDKWAETTKTASFAADKLGAEFESAGVKLAQKLLPAGTHVLQLLGTGLPAAVGAAVDVLRPFGKALEVGGSALGVIAHAVGDVLGALGPFAPELKVVAQAALIMWAAFKGYGIIRAAVVAVMDGFAGMQAKAVNAAGSIRSAMVGSSESMAGASLQAKATAAVMQAEFDQIALAAMNEAAAIDRAAAREAVAFADKTAASKASTDAQVANADRAAAAALAQAKASAEAATLVGASAEESSIAVRTAGAAAATGWSAMLGPLGLVAIGITTLTSLFHGNDQAAQQLKSDTSAYLGTLQQTKGAINDVVVAQVTQKLASEGVYDAARKYKVSLDDVTQAALGSDAATGRLAHGLHGNLDAINGILIPISQQSQGLKDASSQYATATAQAKSNTTATKASSTAAAASVAATLAAANAKKAEAVATAALVTQLQNLAQTQIAAAQSEDQFREGLLQVNKSVKDNGTSLSKNTTKGLANRDMLLSLMSGALSLANAQQKNGKSVDKVTSALSRNVQQIEATATAAGLTKGQVAALIKQMGLTPHDIKTKFHADTNPALAAIAALKARLASLHDRTIHLYAVTSASGDYSPGGMARVGGRASGGGLPDGVSAVGERGPELAIKHGPKVQILSNPQAKSFLSATGMRAPGFADGTGKTYSFGGMEYASAMAAHNAQARAQIAAEKSAARTRAATMAAALRAQVAAQKAAERAAAAAQKANDALAGKITGKDTTGLTGAIGKTVDQIKTAFQTIIADLSKAGYSPSALHSITSRADALLSRQSKLSAELGVQSTSGTTALDKLSAAVSAFNSTASTVASAVAGTFDITTAPGLTAAQTAANSAREAAGGVLPQITNDTFAGIASSLGGDVNDAKSFRSGLAKLHRKGLSDALYDQLAEKGPGSLSTVKTLLTGSKADIGRLSASYGQLGSIGAATGRDVATVVNGATLTTDREVVATLKTLLAQNERLTKQLIAQTARVGHDVGGQLHAGTNGAALRARTLPSGHR